MPPSKARTPWRIQSGDPESLTLRVKLPNGTPVDLSGRTYEAWWRPRLGAPGSASVALQVDLTDAATGVLVVRATAAQTAAMGEDGVWKVREVDGQSLAWGTTAWEQV